MMREYDFRVAGFLFKLHLPEEQDIDRLLPSFRPFRCVTDIQGRAIFNFVAVSSSLSEKGIIRVLEETESDLGHIRLLEMAEGYRVELRYTAGSPVHVLHAEPFLLLPWQISAGMTHMPGKSFAPFAYRLFTGNTLLGRNFCPCLRRGMEGKSLPFHG